ncbi:type II secretion system protein GspM [Oceanibacterium hippocampi]|uniref:General secretion pathway protein M n=1 Tax=Oceanibacterium hippocampi TaxID=745714 RepID=A0A1Y5T703_9PROT|nr:type II secretion system protein GspM [Oceanibacterium hippocampi]SLN56821.1 General secretion pathway protein M [Oceanibacterium hippocampi]
MTIGARSSRLLALLLLAAVILVYVLAGLLPAWNDYADGREALAAQERLVAEMRAIASSPPDAPVRPEPASPSIDPDIVFLEGGSVAQALADLQETVKAALSESGAVLVSFEARPVTVADGYRRISLDVQFSAATASLQAALHRIETAAPALVINTLYVRAQSAASDNPGLHLDVSAEIAGYMRPVEGAGS